MTRFLFKCAILLGGLYAVGLSLWHLGNTAVFAFQAERVPGVVVDFTKRPFEGLTEQLSHGNLPWEGDVAYHPHVRYQLYNLPRTDTELPDLDNRDYADREPVELLINPQNPHQRHINKFKFLWGGDLLLLALGALLLMLSRRLLRRRKSAPRNRKAPAPEPSRPTPPPPAEPAPELRLEAEPAPPRKRRSRKKADGEPAAPKKKSTRTKKAPSDKAAADKPKTPRRRKKTSE